MVAPTTESRAGIKAADLLWQQPEEGVQGKPTMHRERQPRSQLSEGQTQGNMQKPPMWWAGVRAQSCPQAEPASSGPLTRAVFGARVPVEFGASGDCCREAATRKPQTHSEGLR